jgi:hypothetical protein
MGQTATQRHPILRTGTIEMRESGDCCKVNLGFTLFISSTVLKTKVIPRGQIELCSCFSYCMLMLFVSLSLNCLIEFVFRFSFLLLFPVLVHCLLFFKSIYFHTSAIRNRNICCCFALCYTLKLKLYTQHRHRSNNNISENQKSEL